VSNIESAYDFVEALTAAGENKFFQYEFMLSTIARVWLTEAITARDASIRAKALEEAAALCDLKYGEWIPMTEDVNLLAQSAQAYADAYTDVAARIRALATKGPSK
jgi:hypothetical protein